MPRNTKQQHELNVFNLFVKIAGINIDSAPIIQMPPPAPDIICKISGDDYGFELTALTDQAIESKVGSNKPGYSNFRIGISNVVERIESKIENQYSTPRVDLVIHESATPIYDLWTLESKNLDDAIQGVIDRTNFLRVWIVDFSNEIIRCYSRMQTKL